MLWGRALSAHVWGTRSLDLRWRTFALLIDARDLCLLNTVEYKHRYTIRVQNEDTDTATGLVHGAAAP
jgi:hypothetical protein